MDNFNDIINKIKQSHYIFTNFDDSDIDEVEDYLNKHKISFITTSQTGYDYVIAGQNSPFYKKYESLRLREGSNNAHVVFLNSGNLIKLAVLFAPNNGKTFSFDKNLKSFLVTKEKNVGTFIEPKDADLIIDSMKDYKLINKNSDSSLYEVPYYNYSSSRFTELDIFASYVADNNSKAIVKPEGSYFLLVTYESDYTLISAFKNKNEAIQWMKEGKSVERDLILENVEEVILTKDTRIPNTNVILEAGEKIRVIRKETIEEGLGMRNYRSMAKVVPADSIYAIKKSVKDIKVDLSVAGYSDSEIKDYLVNFISNLT